VAGQARSTKSYFESAPEAIAPAPTPDRKWFEARAAGLDVFLGSGSTLIAAESLGRRCYGLEIDPRYCDVIVRRYLAVVGPERAPEPLRQRYGQEASHGRR